MEPVQTARQRYEQLATLRATFLDRGRAASRLTIPALLPPEAHDGFSVLPTPYQGMGARGVNNLASKLLLALLPPNAPFFRLTIDDFALEELTQQEGMRAEVEEALGSIERAIQTEIETTAIRIGAFEALRHLLVAGNVLMYLPPAGGVRVFHLDRYVVKRDPMGHLLETIVKETVAPDVLPEGVREKINITSTAPQKTVDIYTYVRREGDRWLVHQEAGGVTVPGSEGNYPLDKSPWVALRWTAIDGEDYGRGHVEEYLGDLQSLEALTKAVVEGSAAAAKILILVNPNGQTEERDIAEAPNGAVRTGRREDVSVLQLEKYADFRIAFDMIRRIEERLAFAFLLNTAIQRQGERVTAEEIRYMAAELEDTLGGVYSILSQEFQLPLVRRLMHQMERQGRLPTLPEGVVRPAIVTGMEALGRGHDLNRLITFAGQLVPLGDAVFKYLNVGDYITRIGTALGLDMKGLVRSEEEVAAAEQQQQTAMLASQLGPEAMKIASQAMTQQQ